MATSSEDDTARIWETPSGELAVPPLRHFGAVQRVAFSSDGRRVVTASDDNTARVWGVLTGEPLTPPLTHPGWGRITDACFSHDWKHVLTTSADGTARIWELLLDDRPVEDLALLARLLAVSKIDERTAGFVPLRTEDVRKIWNQLRDKYPNP
jgi:WD40 repeat protein